MRFVADADAHPDFFDVHVRGFKQLARLLQAEIIYILDNANLDFLFEKVLKTRNRQIDGRRQVIDDKLLRGVVFESIEYLLYAVIHPLLAEKDKGAAKIVKAQLINFSLQKVMTFSGKALQNYF